MAAYPRWQGELRPGPVLGTIAVEEARRTLRSFWGQIAIFLGFLLLVLFLSPLVSAARRAPDSHSVDYFLSFFHSTLWAGVGVAAIASGPALLDDARRGALELYLSRGVSKRQYLAAKVLSVFGLTSLAVVGPALAYWVLSFLLFPRQPADWLLVPGGVLAEGLLWAGMLTGLGLGLSGLAKSSRAATIVLFGGFAVMDVFVSTLLDAVTGNHQVEVVSPLVALSQLSPAVFHAGQVVFPWWWGFAELLGLMAVGWALVAWKHPRLAGA
jgi:ABC-type transport system involved in multi-copper enzyme maturation permease subunit